MRNAYANNDNADVESRSLGGLAKIMAAVVKVCEAFGLTVSQKKTKTTSTSDHKFKIGDNAGDGGGSKLRQNPITSSILIPVTRKLTLSVRSDADAVDSMKYIPTVQQATYGRPECADGAHDPDS